MSDLIGLSLGPYRILEQIGKGGMATVYKAYHPVTDRYVAIKVLPAELADDPSFLARFEREAKVVASLQHIHILPLFDYGQERSVTYLVMPYISTGTLQDYLARGRPRIEEAARLVCQIAEALDYAHRKGILHRDVKPSNVILDDSANALLADFGLARMAETASSLTGTGVIGTPAYMSPEQGQGLEVDARSDIYSLGVVLYEMMVGEVPFSADTPIAVIFQHVDSFLPPPRDRRPELPRAVENVITRALAKNPDDRFQTASEMAAALQHAVGVSPAPVAVREVKAAPSPARPAKERGKGLLFGLGGAGLAIAGVVGCIVLAIAAVGIALVAANMGRATPVAYATATLWPTATATLRPVATATPQPISTPTPQLTATATESPIKVAILGPLSGDLALAGESHRDGTLLAIEEWNPKGGVLGRKIEPVIGDTKCNASEAIIVGNKVISEDKVRYIVGAVCSSASVPISQIAELNEVLQITGTAFDPAVTVHEDGTNKEYVFRTCFLNPFQGEVMATLAYDGLGLKSAAVLYDVGNDYVKTLAEYFKSAFEAQGGQVLVFETYTQDDTDFSALLAKVADAGAECLFLPDYYDRVNLIAAQIKDKSLEIQLLGSDGWDSSWLDLPLFEGGYYSNYYSPADPRPITQNFVKAYTEKYGAEPEFVATQAYGAANILFESIKAAGVDDPEKVKDAMASITVECVSGDTSFDENGDAIKEAAIIKIEDGGLGFYGFVAPYDTPTPQPEVTITIWHQWGGDYLDNIKVAFDDYTKQHPNVTFDLSKPEDTPSALSIAILAGEGPDIIGWANDAIGVQALAGNIVALDDHGITKGFLDSTYEPAAVRGVVWQGKIWGLPESQEGIAFVYNKALVDDKYLPTDPLDFDDLLAKAKAFYEDTGKYLVCNQGLGNPDAYHVAPIYFGHGVPEYVDDQGKAYLNTPEALAAAEWMVKFSEYAPAETSHDICKAMIVDGEAGAWWTGPWAIADLESAGVDYGILPMGKPFVGIKALLLTKNAVDRGNAEVALDVIKYFTSAEVQKKVALANKTIPASTGAMQDPEIRALVTLAGFGASLNLGVPMANTPYANAQWVPVGEATTAVWTGAQTPEEAMTAAQEAIEEAISEME